MVEDRMVSLQVNSKLMIKVLRSEIQLDKRDLQSLRIRSMLEPIVAF